MAGPARVKHAGKWVALVALAGVSLAGCSSDPAPAASSSPDPTSGGTSVPGVPDADIEFHPLLETYPSVWDALGLDPTLVPMGSWHVLEPDLSILSIETRDEGGARIVRTETGGSVTPLTDWLPTDRGQQWGAIEFSDPWLVYADYAGSHTDGPVTEPGVFLANFDTGEVSVLSDRAYSAPREPCDECGDWMFYTEAAISDTTVYWTDGGPDTLTYERVLSSRPLADGETSRLLTGMFHFDDPSCVTTAGADVRVTGDQIVEASPNSTVIMVWDLLPDGDPVRISPEDGLTGAAMNTLPSTCAGTDIVGWYTPLDGTPLPDSMSGNEGDPLRFLNAIDIVRDGFRARIRIDDDFGLADPISYSAGWVVIRVSMVEPNPYRYLLVDTEEWALYEIDAPEGAVVTYAGLGEGSLWATVDTTLDQDWFSADAILTAPLP